MLESGIVFWPLLPHRDTLGEVVRRVAGRAELTGAESLRLQYVLEADLRHVRIPTPAAGGGRAERLWSHTCFEAFVGLEDSARYLELNFSPSGEWAAYRFESYREGMAPVALQPPPWLVVRRGEQQLELEAEVRLTGALPEWDASKPGREAGDRRLRIALSTVVEDQQGRLSYWALRHPPGRPDFHHPDSFSVALELPSTL